MSDLLGRLAARALGLAPPAAAPLLPSRFGPERDDAIEVADGMGHDESAPPPPVGAEPASRALDPPRRTEPVAARRPDPAPVPDAPHPAGPHPSISRPASTRSRRGQPAPAPAAPVAAAPAPLGTLAVWDVPGSAEPPEPGPAATRATPMPATRSLPAPASRRPPASPARREPGPAADAADGPVVRIHIGRLEVRALAPAPAPAVRPAPAPGGEGEAVSLSDYLRGARAPGR